MKQVMLVIFYMFLSLEAFSETITEKWNKNINIDVTSISNYPKTIINEDNIFFIFVNEKMVLLNDKGIILDVIQLDGEEFQIDGEENDWVWEFVATSELLNDKLYLISLIHDGQKYKQSIIVYEGIGQWYTLGHALINTNKMSKKWSGIGSNIEENVVITNIKLDAQGDVYLTLQKDLSDNKTNKYERLLVGINHLGVKTFTYQNSNNGNDFIFEIFDNDKVLLINEFRTDEHVQEIQKISRYKQVESVIVNQSFQESFLTRKGKIVEGFRRWNNTKYVVDNSHNIYILGEKNKATAVSDFEFVSTYYNNLLAMNRENGKIIWKKDYDFFSPSFFHDGEGAKNILIGSDDTIYVVRDARDYQGLNILYDHLEIKHIRNKDGKLLNESNIKRELFGWVGGMNRFILGSNNNLYTTLLANYEDSYFKVVSINKQGLVSESEKIEKKLYSATSMFMDHNGTLYVLSETTDNKINIKAFSTESTGLSNSSQPQIAGRGYKNESRYVPLKERNRTQSDVVKTTPLGTQALVNMSADLYVLPDTGTKIRDRISTNAKMHIIYQSKDSTRYNGKSDYWYLGYEIEHNEHAVASMYDRRLQERTLGWIHGSAVTIEASKEQQEIIELPKLRGRMNDSKVNVRKGYSLEDEKFDQVHEGQELTILAQTRDTDKIGDMEYYWYQAEYTKGGKTQIGWIYGAFVDVKY